MFARLDGGTIRLPSLRERREDVRPLALHFLSRANQAHRRNVSLAAAALDALMRTSGWATSASSCTWSNARYC